MDSKPLQKGNKENISSDIPKGLISSPETSKTSLQFNRLQPPKEACREDSRLDFGQFTAREAVLDEEYWTAAWLRAESHWEDKASDRYVENYKRKFTEQEFNSIKRNCKSQIGHKSTCILAVKNEPRNVILKNVVGTLDLSMRRLLHGETFPAERVKIPLFCSIQKEGSKYGYISNLCVAKSARRQGIASNMLSFAIKSAIYYGAEQVFVHVHRNNKPAQLLYQKMGFEVVEIASSQLSAEQTYLLCLRAQGLEEKYL
ncbi:hypothetical protein DCAR_0728433 [Daucus carota subsp. sativus]|uniref:N-acetyltransferase domain-containing protein n=2 Tax=Daucus carota subsp. sativus TaxID=79200 RepID=A0AAF0XKY7_DAUCS|nr:hypothetical protein DCAR_0728433 [Daucus carota subsp. sativus]